MKTKGKNLNEKHLEQARVEKPVELYMAPQVEVIDIELTHNILAPSGGDNNTLPGIDDGDWL
ncbi:MAG: hypothetical protein QM237_02745 [Bacteroidota bacterium]|nr:hypothetical protein [Bacteroidota bacterium]HHU97013.1 hypothetical protein [Petrimonas sp.]